MTRTGSAYGQGSVGLTGLAGVHDRYHPGLVAMVAGDEREGLDPGVCWHRGLPARCAIV